MHGLQPFSKVYEAGSYSKAAIYLHVWRTNYTLKRIPYLLLVKIFEFKLKPRSVWIGASIPQTSTNC